MMDGSVDCLFASLLKSHSLASGTRQAVCGVLWDGAPTASSWGRVYEERPPLPLLRPLLPANPTRCL